MVQARWRRRPAWSQGPRVHLPAADLPVLRVLGWTMTPTAGRVVPVAKPTRRAWGPRRRDGPPPRDGLAMILPLHMPLVDGGLRCDPADALAQRPWAPRHQGGRAMVMAGRAV